MVNEEKIQGEIRLRVEATHGIQMIALFIASLRQTKTIRILELLGTPQSGVDIRLVLRGPFRLLEFLLELEGVSDVEAPQDMRKNYQAPLFKVHLAEMAPSS